MPTYTATFEETSSSSRSKVFTIPNIHSVKNLSVNTGSATHSLAGTNLTLNVSGGTHTRSATEWYTPSQYVSEYQTSSSRLFYETMDYNKNGYSGTLSATGDAYVTSGTYTPAQTTNMGTSVYQDSYGVTWTYNAGSWTTSQTTTFPTPQNAIPYSDSDGYSGTLYYSGAYGAFGAPRPTGTASNGAKQTTYGGRYCGYDGTVSTRESDTRQWKRDYAGWVYGTPYSVTTYYYAYTVTVNYVDFPTVGLKVNSSDVINNGSLLVSNKNNLSLSFIGDDQDEGTAINYSVFLRNVVRVPYTAGTKGATVNHTITHADLVPGNNLVTVKVKDQYNAETVFNYTIRNKVPQTLSLSSVLETEQALGYGNTLKKSLNDIKPSGYNGKLSFSDIINSLS